MYFFVFFPISDPKEKGDLLPRCTEVTASGPVAGGFSAGTWNPSRRLRWGGAGVLSGLRVSDQVPPLRSQD